MESIVKWVEQYNTLAIAESLAFSKFNEYSIVHHSAAIEGSTLTETDTELLLGEGITPKGKPLAHSLMVKDHYAALLFVLECAKNKTALSLPYLQKVNALVMQGTGSVRHTVFGEIDERQGEFRKGNVSAGGSYFVNHDKVVAYTTKLIDTLNENITGAHTIEKQFELSFIAHFDLVSIHPFYRGNGRTSRLLMNHVQRHFGIPLTIVYKEDKADYIQA
jgi:Fic family protein